MQLMDSQLTSFVFFFFVFFYNTCNYVVYSLTTGKYKKKIVRAFFCLFLCIKFLNVNVKTKIGLELRREERRKEGINPYSTQVPKNFEL